MQKRTERLLVVAITLGFAALIYVQFGNGALAASTIFSGLIILVVSARQEP